MSRNWFKRKGYKMAEVETLGNIAKTFKVCGHNKNPRSIKGRSKLGHASRVTFLELWNL